MPTKKSTKKLIASDWRNEFDTQQHIQIEFSTLYAEDYDHGADGHNSMRIIAKMADMLDDLTKEVNDGSND